MDYTLEYERLMKKRDTRTTEETAMQRADRRYKQLIEKGILRREEPFVVMSTTVSKTTFNR